MTTLQSLEIIDLLEEEILSFQLSRDFMWPRVQRVIWHHGRVLLIIRHDPVKFSGCKLCGIGELKLLICYVISRDHVIRESWVNSSHHKPLLYFCKNTKECKNSKMVIQKCKIWKYISLQSMLQDILQYGWIPLIINHYSTFVAIGLAEGEILFFIGHVTSHPQVINGLCSVMKGCLSF